MSENNNNQNNQTENLQDVEFIKKDNENSKDTDTINSGTSNKGNTKSKIEEGLKKYNFNTDPNKLPKPLAKNKDSIVLAILVHLSMILTLSPIIPVIVYLLKKDDQFIIENAKEDINLYITFFLANFFFWIIVFFGKVYLFTWLLALVFFVAVVYACIENYKGRVARVPYIFRIID